jgi:hypothetical protein
MVHAQVIVSLGVPKIWWVTSATCAPPRRTVAQKTVPMFFHFGKTDLA